MMTFDDRRRRGVVYQMVTSSKKDNFFHKVHYKNLRKKIFHENNIFTISIYSIIYFFKR